MNLFIRRPVFVAFAAALAVIIFLESLITVANSLSSTTHSQLGSILPWFAGLEAIGSVLLLIPQTRKIGGWMLLVIFFIALIVHGPAEQLHLFVYAAGVVLVIYGNASESRAGETDGGKIDTEDS